MTLNRPVIGVTNVGVYSSASYNEYIISYSYYSNFKGNLIYNKVDDTVNNFNTVVNQMNNTQESDKITPTENIPLENITLASLQVILSSWVRLIFNEITINEDTTDKVYHRCDRLLEEVFELLQAVNYDYYRIDKIKHYVYNRPSGEVPQELAGVMTTLLALSNTLNYSLEQVTMDELVRIFNPQTIEKIRNKERDKLDKLS